MQKEKTLILLRHGDTGLSGKFIGFSDVDLHSDGIREVQRSSQYLSGRKIDKIYCSPLLRCRKTLELLNITAPVELCSELQEVNFGDWEGLSSAVIADSTPELLKVWGNDPEGFTFPGGESIQNFRVRVKSFLKKLLLCEDSDILIISHGGVIRTLLCFLLDISLDKEFIFSILPGRYTVVHYFEQGALLEGLNLGGIPWPT